MNGERGKSAISFGQFDASIVKEHNILWVLKHPSKCLITSGNPGSWALKMAGKEWLNRVSQVEELNQAHYHCCTLFFPSPLTFIL